VRTDVSAVSCPTTTTCVAVGEIGMQFRTSSAVWIRKG
jgi:hypothetical protein